jgi:hypothetical protein
MNSFLHSLDFLENLQKRMNYNINYVGNVPDKGRKSYHLKYSPAKPYAAPRNIIYKDLYRHLFCNPSCSTAKVRF